MFEAEFKISHSIFVDFEIISVGKHCFNKVFFVLFQIVGVNLFTASFVGVIFIIYDLSEFALIGFA